MKSVRAVLSAAVVVCVSTSVAHAVTLRTPVVGGNSSQIVDCAITNFGTKPVEFSVLLLGILGVVVTPQVETCASGIVEPFKTCQVLPGQGAQVACIFTVKSSKVRAVAQVFDTSNSNKLDLIVPATK